MHRHSPASATAGTVLLLANLCATGMLVGLIWTVQLVHYPLLAAVGEAALPAYLAEHATRMVVLAGPWMVAELTTALLLVWRRPPAISLGMASTGVLLCLVAWGSTFLVQAPLIETLQARPDRALLDSLATTNWIRTVAWTARGTLCLMMAWRVIVRPETAR